MAATNFTPISIYHSTTASAAPTAGNLVNGELAINITDGKLYYKDNGGAVQVIATKGTGTIGGSTTQVQYNNAGALAGSANFTFNGTTATINTLNLTNALGAAYGGTAQSTYAQGDLLYASAANTLAKLPIGISTYILTSNGTIPGWAIPSSVVIGTATNLAGGAAGSVPYQSGASTTTFLSIGTANQVITSTGTAPQWSSSLTLTGLSNSGLTTLDKTVTVGNTSFNGAAVFAPSTPAKVYLGTGTVTDVTSAIAATNAAGAIVALGVTPIAATNANVTYTNASTLYIAGAPSAGTNITITNPYALYVAAGDAYFGASVVLNAGTANGVPYLSSPGKVLTTGSALTFNGTNFDCTGAITAGTQVVVGAPQSTDGNIRLSNTPTLASGNMYGIRFADSTFETNASIYAEQNSASNNAASIVFGVNAGTGGAVLTSAPETMRLTSTGLKASIAGTNADPVFSYTSDTNTGIFFPAADKLGFTAGGGSDQMVLTSTGLGIGTSSPQGPLDVAASGATVNQFLTGGVGNNAVTGIFRIGSGAGRGASIQGFRGSSSNIHSLEFYTYNSGDVFGMRLDQTGNLGIGTNNPGYKLEVNGGASDAMSLFNSTNSNGPHLRFAASSTVKAYIGGAPGFLGSGTADDLGLRAVGSILFATNGSAVDMTLDSSGNLGLGVTPSAWGSDFRVLDIVQFGTRTASLIGGSGQTGIGLALGVYNNNTDWIATVNSAPVGRYEIDGAGNHTFFTYNSTVTAGNPITFTQAMTLLANGNLGIGETNPSRRLVVSGGEAQFNNGGDFNINSTGSAVNLYGAANVPMIFYTNTAERARITSGGYFKASNAGTYVNAAGAYHELRQTADSIGLYISSTNASLANECLYITADRNTTNNSFYAIAYFNNGAAAAKFRVADSGDVTNTNGTYGTISDAKMKTDIVDAGSQWSDIKALRFRKFKMKNDPSGLVQLGVVAQELEQTSPGLVDEHADKDAEGNDLGTTTKSVKTSVLLMKAAVALQEAMARIEKLEAEVAALQGA